MNNLHRSLAPISDAAWTQIEEEARRQHERVSVEGGKRGVYPLWEDGRDTAALAKAVVAKRPLKTVKDLDSVLSSLTKEQRTELYGRLFVPINLNTATDEEILLIPGVGNRMLREFKEYRPYTALAQFHREIGKYVDEKELARLEQYVFVPVKK